ncbi:MAG: HEAT repeat domain-containing protein [Myxococcales bacterium]|nr:HEAT repeat domain-containing protein [Myxococcales bacterium]
MSEERPSVTPRPDEVNYADLWQRLVGMGVLTAAERDAAAAHQKQRGGTPDTALLETRSVSRQTRRALAAECAAWLGVPVATDAALHNPQPEALKVVPAPLARHHALLPVAVDDERVVVAAPVLPPHVLREVEFVVGKRIEHHFALEVDVREAQVRHLGFALPARFMPLTRAPMRTPGPETSEQWPERITPVGGFRVVNAPTPAPARTEPAGDGGRRRVVLRFEEPSATPLPVIRPSTDSLEIDLDEAVMKLGGPESGGAEAALRAAGGRALDALARAFPGPLRLDRADADPEVTPISAHGPVIDLLLGLGERATGALATLATHPSPDVRYYAVGAFTALPVGAHLSVLAQRVFDPDSGVRTMAGRALTRARNEPGFPAVIQTLAAATQGGTPAHRRQAIEALGATGHLDAGPSLVARLGDPELGELAHRSLMRLCCVDLGREAWKWHAWLQKNARRHRVEVLIDGLTSDQRLIRQHAIHELTDTTGEQHGYRADLPTGARRSAQERWRRWWSGEGQGRFR